MRVCDYGYHFPGKKRKTYQNHLCGYPYVIDKHDEKLIKSQLRKHLCIHPAHFGTTLSSDVPLGSYLLCKKATQPICTSKYMYFGVLAYNFAKKAKPLWIYRRVHEAPSLRNKIFNPKLFPTKIDNDLHVFDDSNLVSGTKQRALVSLLTQLPDEKVVYAGPAQGYAQVALAFAAHLTKKTPILFLSSYDKDFRLTKKAQKINPKLVVRKLPMPLKDLEKIALKYCNETPGAFLIPFGLRFPGFINTLSDALTIAISPKVREEVKCLWLVVGSATILTALYPVFPHATFHAVQVGRKVYPDMVDSQRVKIYVSPLSFREDAILLPPYNSKKNYDAKLWQFVKKLKVKKGVYIWNVAGN